MNARDLIRQCCIVTASNDDESLSRNLMASPLVRELDVPVHVERGAPSAAAAYNRGLDATRAPYVIFAHQDVYFPQGWEEHLARAVEAVSALDANWALIAPYGIETDGSHAGHVWSTGISRELGQPFSDPRPAQSYDELTIIMRRDAGLRFDETLSLWHFYGTDIVQIARAAGRSAWIADLPVVHNDSFHARLGSDFRDGYRFIQRKWADQLPLRSPIAPITRSGLALHRYLFRAWRSKEKRRGKAGDAHADPRIYARACGWESED